MIVSLIVSTGLLTYSILFLELTVSTVNTTLSNRLSGWTVDHATSYAYMLRAALRNPTPSFYHLSNLKAAND
jgi:hypothetical protein